MRLYLTDSVAAAKERAYGALKRQQKTCARCGRPFSPGPKMTWKEWANRLFCSRACFKLPEGEARVRRLRRYHSYGQSHLAEKSAYNAAYRKKRREELCEYLRRWRKENREYVKQTRAAKYAANRAEILEQNRLSRIRLGKEHIKARRQRDYQRNKERYIESKRNRQAITRGAEGKHTTADVRRIYERQKGRCAYCKKLVGKRYHVDHIIPVSKGGSNWPTNLQILCPFCNNSKNALLPHEFARKRGLLL